jgi:hypothetical protein
MEEGCPMMPWNDALAAYDEEYEVIEGLREEYTEFLHSVYEHLTERSADILGDGWTVGQEGKDHRTEWWAQPRGDSKVSIYVRAARPWGGPPETFLFIIRLDDYDRFPLVQRPLRHNLIVSKVSGELESLPGQRPETLLRGKVLLEWIRIAAVSMKADPGEQLAELLVTYKEFALLLDGVVETTRWLDSALLRVLARKPPSGIPRGLSWAMRSLYDTWAATSSA